MAEGEDRNVPVEPLTPDEMDRFFERLEITPKVRVLPMIGVLQVGGEAEQAVIDYKYLVDQLPDDVDAVALLRMVYETKRG